MCGRCLAVAVSEDSRRSTRLGHVQRNLCLAGDFTCTFPFSTQLLDYVMTTLLFSDKNVDSTLITWNRVVLLHGKASQLWFV